jgi:hypothetical protein
MSADEYRGTATEAQHRKTVLNALAHYGWTVIFALPDVSMSALSALANGKRRGGGDGGPKIPALIALLAAISGWPDLTVGHPEHGIIWIELKTKKGAVRPNQRDVIALLRACRGRVYVSRSGDDTIFDVLAGDH